MEDGWSVVLYQEESGRRPVREFLTSIDPGAQDSLLASIEKLRLLNIRAREPLVRHLDGKLWELRDEHRTNIYWVIYFFFRGQRIVLLHGFQKKTQKTPRQEIETAIARYDRFIKREGGDTR